MPLSREQILAAEDLETRKVSVPEWADPASGDDTVLVRALSGTDRDAYEASLVQMRGNKTVPQLGNIRAKLVSRAIVDEDGNRLFSDADISALGKKSAAALSRVFTVAAEMSGLDAKDIEEIEGNSEAAQSGASTSS